MLVQGVAYYLLSALLLAAHSTPLAAGLCGFLLLGFERDGDERSRLSAFFLKLGLLGVAPFVFYFSAPALSLLLLGGPVWPPAWDLGIAIATCSVSVAIAMAFLRKGAAKLNQIKAKFTRGTELERNRKTDVREIHKFLPAVKGAFDPTRYFDDRKGLFIGLDEKTRPVYMDYEAWKISHCLLSGRTRSGKGVAAQILLTQAIQRGEYVVVLDPKCDNWMPHIFKKACDDAGLPYRFLDLRQSAPPQTNLFAGCDLETLENMLVGGFSLTEKGEAADFYRLADRKAARRCAAWLADNGGATAGDALIAHGEDWAETAPAFHAYMAEMAELQSVNLPSGGIDVAAGEREGGVLYVVGDMINPRIIRMQRMILLRLLFLAKARDDLSSGSSPRTVTVFADEFKVHISRPFMTSLGASAGWGLHSILAFQSLQDLADCPADLDKDAVRGAVMENCSVQLSYAIKDPETAEWLSASTGVVLVDDEARQVRRNVALSETVDGDRTLRQAERYLVDTNMLMNLPKGCGVLAIVGRLAQFCYTSPVMAERTQEAITPVLPLVASDGASRTGDAEADADRARSAAARALKIEELMGDE